MAHVISVAHMIHAVITVIVAHVSIGVHAVVHAMVVHTVVDVVPVHRVVGVHAVVPVHRVVGVHAVVHSMLWSIAPVAFVMASIIAIAVPLILDGFKFNKDLNGQMCKSQLV